VLQILKNNSPYTAILLFIFCLAVKLQALRYPALPVAVPSQVLYGGIVSGLGYIFGKSAFAYTFFSVIMLYLQALYLNAIASKYRLFNRSTYIPAYAYLLFTSLHPALSQFSPQLVVNWLLLLALSELLNLQQSHQPNKNLFNIGFILMWAALVQYAAIVFIVFLFVGLAILRPFSFREWAICLSGLLMPLYMTAVVLFLADKLPLLRQWPDVGVSLPRKIQAPLYFSGLLGGLVLLLTGSLIVMQSQLPKSAIYVRRCWTALGIMFIFSLLAALFSDKAVNAAWLMPIPALSMIVAPIFYNERSKRVSNISLYFSLIFLLFCQIFLPL